jgi:hypothetical protein
MQMEIGVREWVIATDFSRSSLIDAPNRINVQPS